DRAVGFGRVFGQGRHGIGNLIQRVDGVVDRIRGNLRVQIADRTFPIVAAQEILPRGVDYVDRAAAARRFQLNVHFTGGDVFGNANRSAADTQISSDGVSRAIEESYCAIARAVTGVCNID